MPGHQHGQVAGRGLPVEAVDHGACVLGLGFQHIAEQHPVAWVALVAQDLETEHQILGRDPRAVRKRRLGPQEEPRPGAVGGIFDGLGNQPVHGVGLVIRAGHQRVEGEAHALGRFALQDKRVQAVESGAGARAQTRPHAALRRVWVGIGEMGEVGWVLEVAKGRDPVRADDAVFGACRGGQKRGPRRRRSQSMKRAPCDRHGLLPHSDPLIRG